MPKAGLLTTLFLLLSFVSLDAQPDKPNFIIDADTANEIDDLYALVRAIGAPEINLLGITSAQFHISPLASDSSVYESQVINEDLIRLLGRHDIALPLGSTVPLVRSDKPQVSAASSFIIEQAHALPAGVKLDLVILGGCTNVASALLQDPTIISKVRVHYLGFWHNAEKNTYNKKEFNSGNDTLAVNVLLDMKDLDLTVMTATTSMHLVFHKEEVDQRLAQWGAIGPYLIDRWESHKRWWTKEDKLKAKWVMWDVAIIEALIHPELATKQSFLTPPENTQRQITIYTNIDVQAMMKDYWDALQNMKLP